MRLKLLHAEEAASYHAEVHVPPSVIVYNRLLDAPPRSGIVELRGTEAGPLLINEYGLLREEKEEPWAPPTHATVYINNIPEQPIGSWADRQLNADFRRDDKNDSDGYLTLSVWVGADSRTVQYPTLFLTGLMVLLILYVSRQLGVFGKPIPNTNDWAVAIASSVIALFGTLVGLLFIPGEHAVAQWLYRPVRGVLQLLSFAVVFGSLALPFAATSAVQTALRHCKQVGQSSLVESSDWMLVVAVCFVFVVWPLGFLLIGCKKIALSWIRCQAFGRSSKVPRAGKPMIYPVNARA